ncbi:hypothetical protein M0R45_001880 [Rubus argutus]|uniref:Uncharacterized protein n=1 Tax=Rubus argutus TaxID=59490 RepID=A0AAW1VI67_RUBAR
MVNKTEISIISRDTIKPSLDSSSLHHETGDDSLLPMIAFQVNVFACGGIAIGGSASHKLCDGLAANSILESWAAIFRGKRAKIIHPNFSQASLVFPPRALLPKKYLDLADSFWFKENNYVTRRFVFSVKAIATLQEKLRSKCVPKPSRIEVLTCFIWKHAMASSRALSPGTSPRTSIVAHAMNMRSRMKPQMSSANIIGNFFWWATTVADSSKLKEAHELCDLVNQINESLRGFDRDYFESLQGEEGFGAISENFTVFMESQWGKGIEAWVTLEEKQMDVLERDPEFLAFASPNPGISSM